MTFYVVDAEGRLINRKTVTKIEKPPTPPEETPSEEELNDLEDAIFESKEHRVKFLKSLTEKDEDFEKFISHLETRRKKGLLRCWKKMNWRPSKDKKRIVMGCNPYKVKK